MKQTILSLIILMIFTGCGSGGTGSKFEVVPKPKIVGESRILVPENKREVFTIQTEREKDIFAYNISGKDRSSFDCDPLTGEVTFREPADFEQQSEYNITAVVDDTLSRRDTRDFTISVIDSQIEPRSFDPVNIPIEEVNVSQFGNPFITTWKTDNNGSSASNQITIPTKGDDYNYTVDWGDGTATTDVSTDITHTYTNSSITNYTVKIYGDFPRIFFSNNSQESDAKKLLTIEKWGDIKWSSMAGAFTGCTNLEANTTDDPDLSNVTNMEYMFFQCSAYNEDIARWDVSNVTNMLCALAACPTFNQDIGGWDVSNVTNMIGAFLGASSFNHDITDWDVSSVIDMRRMFYNATSFNQDIGSWDVSNVTIMDHMFMKASSFNQDLNAWDTSNVGKYMQNMFADTALEELPSWYPEDKK